MQLVKQISLAIYSLKSKHLQFGPRFCRSRCFILAKQNDCEAKIDFLNMLGIYAYC